MGREATITYEQVAAAADAMKIAGSKPTSRAIRERLGNTGSMGTVNKLLQDWRAGQERRIANALVLPATLQRAILEFMDQELTGAKTALEAELAEQQQEAADLATENERQAFDVEDKAETVTALQAELANLQGRMAQIEVDLEASRLDGERERKAAEAARTELAKSLLRLEAMPRLEADLASLRLELGKERHGRVVAEQQAAVLGAKLEAAIERSAKADSAALDALAQARSNGEAVFLEVAKVEAAKNIIANLSGKLEAMQAQIERQTQDLDAAREGGKNVGSEAAVPSGKLAEAKPRTVKSPKA
jgi:colicin import membrane protein